MAIRIRRIEDRIIAICAARSVPKEGDKYLDDGQHYALAEWVHQEHCKLFKEEGDDNKFDQNAIDWINKNPPDITIQELIAVGVKIANDCNSNRWIRKVPVNPVIVELMEQEESNNENRSIWDTMYGNPNWDGNLRDQDGNIMPAYDGGYYGYEEYFSDKRFAIAPEFNGYNQ